MNKISPTSIIHNLSMSIAVLLFNIISIYTTYKGFCLIWSEGASQTVIAVLFAVSIGIIMIYLTLDIASLPGKKIGKYIIGYLIIASISIFFNFNFLFNEMAVKQIEYQDYQDLRSLMSKLSSKAEHELEKYYNINKIEKELNLSLSGMNYEIKRPDIPGKGTFYKEHLKDYETLKLDYELVVKKYNDAKNLIEKGQSQFPISLNFETYDIAHQKTNYLRAYLNSFINDVEAAYNFEIQLNPQEKNLLQANGKKTELWYSLSIIFKESNEFLSGNWNRPIFFKVAIAFFLSLLIDLTVFFVIVFTRRKLDTTSKSSEQLSSSPKVNIWEQEDNLWDQ